MPSAAIAGGDLRMSSVPSSLIEPRCGRYTPFRQLKIDVLPAPFGPITANSSPRSTLERHAVERGDAAEAQLEVLGDEQRLAHATQRRLRR